MALFEFDTGGAAANQSTTGTTAALNFLDNGVNFTLSTTANPGQGFLSFSPGGAGGFLSISDFGADTGVFTLAVNDPTNDWISGASLTIRSVLSGTWNVTFVNSTNTALNQQFTGINGATVLAPAAAAYSSIRFTTSTAGDAHLAVESLNATIVCYLEGTGIATPNGDVAVQDLRPGDTILTADGGETSVKWVGIQPVQTRLTHPARINPICLTAGSVAHNVPAQDLYVSPDHAIAIDGILYNASTLVNGRSIYMVPKMPLDGFTYYHVETDAHELILAEGCAAETYLDGGGFADNFVNAGDRAKAPMIAAMDMPRVSSIRLVPTQVIDQLNTRADEIAATHTPIAEVA